jgi:hypothetical protein
MCNYDYDSSKTIGFEPPSLTRPLEDARENRFMEFLIILQDNHYKKGFLGGKSIYDKIMKYKYLFPGNLLVLHKDTLEWQTHIKIDGAIIIKKLYVKLDKENIYVDASKYQEKLIQSTISEFMRIIFSLNPQHITLKMSNDNNDSLSAHLNASVNIKGILAGIGGSNEKLNAAHSDNSWILNFDDRNKYIDVNIFLDNTKFYYLPYHPEWNDVIRNRVLYGVKDYHYVYNYNDLQEISNDFIAKLQVLDIDFKYDKKKYENFSLEYNIVYYPLMKCENCGSNKHNIKDCIELKKQNEEKKPAEINILTSILHNVFGFSKIQN